MEERKKGRKEGRGMGQGINNKNINKDEKTNIQFFNEVRVIETNSKEKRYNPGREYKRQVEQKKMGGGRGGNNSREFMQIFQDGCLLFLNIIFVFFKLSTSRSTNEFTALHLVCYFCSPFRLFLFYSCRFRLVWFIAVD